MRQDQRDGLDESVGNLLPSLAKTPPVTSSRTRGPRGTSNVSGPGQQASASTAADWGMVAAQAPRWYAAAM